MSQWFSEWPVNPGYYWFYGKRSRMSQKDELHVVQVWKISNGVTYVADGTFIFKEDGADGVWLVLDQPNPPARTEQ